MSDKKQKQLGMNPSTASGRLVKDILWSLITETKRDVCYKCNEPMCRKTFSVEHKEPWLDSLDPLKLYFDLDNITFTHLRCNIRDARQVRKIYNNAKEGQKARDAVRIRPYDREIRKEQYKRTGK